MFFSLQLHPGISTDSAWHLLATQDVQVLFSEEEEGIERLVIKTSMPSDKLLKAFSFVAACQEIQLPEMNWEEEWKLHAPGFLDGKVPLDLKPFGKDQVIQLTPGAGFGDLSHPTTRLVLEMMKGRVMGKDVVDIGSGSGVLSIAAAALGAKSVIGIDIDPAANLHAEQNALLNGFPEIKFYLPEEVPEKSCLLILMNMITSEQKVAWKSFSKGKRVSGELFTSGVLKEQEREYQEMVEDWGGRVEEVIEEGIWLGLRSLF